MFHPAIERADIVEEGLSLKLLEALILVDVGVSGELDNRPFHHGARVSAALRESRVEACTTRVSAST